MILNSMIKHNEMVNTNNFVLTHFGMTWEEYQKLPNVMRKVCGKHLEENCNKCKNIRIIQ